MRRREGSSGGAIRGYIGANRLVCSDQLLRAEEAAKAAIRAWASGVAMAAPIDRASSLSCSANVRSGCERTSRFACP